MIRCLPTNLTDIDVYHLVRKWITGGLSNVMHRVNRSGIDFIKRIQFDKDNKKVSVLTTDHRITHVVGVDFNSLYPNVMSSEPHQFIRNTNCKMYMCGSQTGKIIEVKGHIVENYINDFINFPPILRNYEFTTDERTIDDVKQIVLFNRHDQFNSFIKEFTKDRIEAKLDENKGQKQFFKIVMNSSYGNDGMNTEKYHKVKIMNKKQTERAIISNVFMDEQKVSEDSYHVQMNPEHCSYMNRIHFIEGDTDSAYWAISGNPSEDFTQQFNAVINDRDFYNENAKYFLPTISIDVHDEKKILGLAIERQGSSMQFCISFGNQRFELMQEYRISISWLLIGFTLPFAY
ncbi:MAG: hypothetical protein EZS28_016796 [Streblomastix strix]|uniref:DNA-directed DNA polymerase n=1 Tax=Streblomastix strix TaxID=222440 RepID=A0A5J4VZ58_9EUKA|nr:MAG: hypothetical protein EZS28_016796 [Streblomastix strix]